MSSHLHRVHRVHRVLTVSTLFLSLALLLCLCHRVTSRAPRERKYASDAARARSLCRLHHSLVSTDDTVERKRKWKRGHPLMMQAKNTQGKRQQMQESSICFCTLFSRLFLPFCWRHGNSWFTSRHERGGTNTVWVCEWERERERKKDAISYVHVKKCKHTGNKTRRGNTSTPVARKTRVCAQWERKQWKRKQKIQQMQVKQMDTKKEKSEKRRQNEEREREGERERGKNVRRTK